MPASAPSPTRLQVWLRAVRAPSMFVTIIPVLQGGGFALIDRAFDGWTFLATLIAVLLLQAGAALLNDYFDYIKGADLPTGAPLLTSPLAMGYLSIRQVYVVGWLFFLLAVLVGGYLVYVGGFYVFVIGLVGLLAGYFYSGTRYALSYRVLGELAIFLLLGPLMSFGTYYVMVKIAYLHVFLNGIPMGLLAAAVVHLNNMRDAEHDAQIGKHTLATVLGREKSKWLYDSLVLLAYLLPFVLWSFHQTPPWTLLTLMTCPIALRNMRVVQSTNDEMELNLAFGLTMLLHLLFGLLYVFGIFLAYFLQSQ